MYMLPSFVHVNSAAKAVIAAIAPTIKSLSAALFTDLFICSYRTSQIKLGLFDVAVNTKVLLVAKWDMIDSEFGP